MLMFNRGSRPESRAPLLTNTVIKVTSADLRAQQISAIIDLFSLGGLFSHCRPRDDTLENSCFQIFK